MGQKEAAKGGRKFEKWMDLVKRLLCQFWNCKRNALLHEITIIAKRVRTLLLMPYMECLPNDSKSVNFVSIVEFLFYMKTGNTLWQTDTTNQSQYTGI